MLDPFCFFQFCIETGDIFAARFRARHSLQLVLVGRSMKNQTCDKYLIHEFIYFLNHPALPPLCPSKGKGPYQTAVGQEKERKILSGLFTFL